MTPETGIVLTITIAAGIVFFICLSVLWRGYARPMIARPEVSVVIVVDSQSSAKITPSASKRHPVNRRKPARKVCE